MRLFLPLTVAQIAFYLLFALALLVFYAHDYKVCYTVLTFALCGAYGLMVVFRLVSVALALLKAALGRPDEHRIGLDELKALKDADLPVYTILVPMYKEPEVAQKIARYMTELDYPQDKLDVKLLLEEDDPETRQKIGEIMDKLPSCFEVIVCKSVPKGEPKTKPRACNWGLERAKGEYLVIYDAEDRPDGDQLKKAVVAFRRLEKDGKKAVACLQAKLNYFNAKQNALTRFFTLEYTNWFDLFLPGLHALYIPIPLGGTSNHFKTSVIKELGGWDPFNVTEDCDLGMRLARRKYRTEVLDSTTWEEANSRVGNWVRQRSRWIKGYFQTHLVHTRDSFVPPLLLGWFFWWLMGEIALILSGADGRQPSAGVLAVSGPAWWVCAFGCAASLGLGLWQLGARVLAWLRKSPVHAEGRLGFYDALTFRLTVGGMSLMLLLNLLFWPIALGYLFREPIGNALPAAVADYPIDLFEGHTLREVLTKDWRLYYDRVTVEGYEGTTVYTVAADWWGNRKSWAQAQEALKVIDEWSYYSQLLYPVAVGLFLANLVFVLLGLVSCAKRGLWGLAPFALAMPAYWVLISIAAVKGALQLGTNPYYWEKTVHGFAQPPGPDGNMPGGGGGPGKHANATYTPAD